MVLKSSSCSIGFTIANGVGSLCSKLEGPSSTRCTAVYRTIFILIDYGCERGRGKAAS
jgi:hypothetical protein